MYDKFINKPAFIYEVTNLLPLNCILAKIYENGSDISKSKAKAIAVTIKEFKK